MEFARLVALCIVSLCCYGAAQGGISALLCPEAFTLGRPPLSEGWPAVALGAVWGALDLLIPATAAGLGLAIAANAGPRVALKASFFHRVLPGLLAIMTLGALVSGAMGFFLTRTGRHEIVGPMRAALAVEKHPMLAAVWWASLGTLLVHFASAVVLAAWTWRRRAYFEELLRKG